jgi:anti-sigma B factor antagonist
MDTTPSGDPAHLDRTQFAVETELTGRSVRLVVHGELDLATAAAFEGALRSSWSRDVECVEIDLRGLTFIGSAGIAAILAARGRARETGCTLALVRGPDSVHRIFELTGIASRLEFCAAPAGGRGASLRLVR